MYQENGVHDLINIKYLSDEVKVLFYIFLAKEVVLISDGNSEHVVHAGRSYMTKNLYLLLIKSML